MATTITSRKTTAERFLQLACTDVERAYADLTTPGLDPSNR